jgi:hypothetical protein
MLGYLTPSSPALVSLTRPTRRILRLLIERIDVAPDGISVTLHAAGVRSLVTEFADQELPALAQSELLLEAAE